MKIYTRTYLQVVSIIVISTVLTFVLTADFLMRSSRKQRIEQLKDEAEQVSRNLYLQKNSAWIAITRIHQDREMAHELASDTPRGRAVIERLASRVEPGVADFFIVNSANFSLTVPEGTNRGIPSDFHLLTPERRHPYLVFRIFDNRVWMIGGVRAADEDGRGGGSVFLVKELDDEFARGLAFGTAADILILVNDNRMAGTMPEKRLALPAGGLDIAAYPGIQLSGDEWNIAVFRQDSITPSHDSVTIAVLSKDISFREDMSRIFLGLTATILSSAFISSLVSIFISRTISRPMALLSGAFLKINKGNLSTRLNTDMMRAGSSERMLFEDFNEMVVTLESDRSQMDRQIRQIDQLREDNALVLASLRSGVGIIDENFRIEMANPRLTELLQLNDGNRGLSINQIDGSLFSPGVVRRFRALMEGRIQNYRRIRQGRGELVFELAAFAYAPAPEKTDSQRLLLVLDDVTERTNAEHAMFQAERISSLSLLSAGAAHEINNPVGSIMINAQNLLEGETDRSRRRTLEWIVTETRRIAHTVRRLLDFSAADSRTLGGVSLGEVVRETVSYFDRGKADGPRFKLEIADSLPTVSIPAGDFRQILINLIQNASESRSGSVKIHIQAQNEAGTMLMRVTDDGPGIDESVRGRIFDPFFTTKGSSGGTGLGLSVVYGILKRYGGDIRVESSSAGGTTMVMIIPREDG